MKNLTILAAAPLFAIALAPAQDISGEWHASLDAKDDGTLRLALHITRELRATLDSADEGGMELTVDSIDVRGSDVRFEMKSAGGVFQGTITAGGLSIVGSWTQNGTVWPLTWERGEDPANVTRLFDQQEALKRGRTYTQWFYDGRLADLWPKFSPVMQQALGSQANLSQLRDETRQQLGKEARLDQEIVRTEGALQVYRRLGKFDKSNDLVEVLLAFDARGAVAGFSVRPLKSH